MLLFLSYLTPTCSPSRYTSYLSGDTLMVTCCHFPLANCSSHTSFSSVLSGSMAAVLYPAFPSSISLAVSLPTTNENSGASQVPPLSEFCPFTVPEKIRLYCVAFSSILIQNENANPASVTSANMFSGSERRPSTAPFVSPPGKLSTLLARPSSQAMPSPSFVPSIWAVAPTLLPIFVTSVPLSLVTSKVNS